MLYVTMLSVVATSFCFTARHRLFDYFFAAFADAAPPYALMPLLCLRYASYAAALSFFADADTLPLLITLIMPY